ncbi:dephospho-CoA kinase [Tepidimonas taiwanensis]|uniref:Dephospho-CoA kinase n=1 Tax=Tepidimonas taiwanensis TaxID=307486 RepID=A0A554XAU2_9BURK|nr:dephospho-CoA kinase [Tepidimonas taiwanensis]MCX7693188.1 dephospho-CoA kinase [Tepidimonas taiwanensis]MDM7463343.1 dephospho-CoA kinase [Tepidimonas taiwanensis]TSE32950.1 Dephospho-CoA kinase [Tepidimonas taiwanensis]UBQ04516.1 dephospho-CoA kinase [Tepidimonas taiwanensis]
MSAPETRRPLRIGLTGGIGSGKSTVAAILTELGAPVVDADALSRASTAPGGAAIDAIRRTFGADYIRADGALDRDRMRALVFADPEAKARLEAIIHPIVRAEIDRRIAACTADTIVLDLPLLVESDAWRQRCDRVWVVDCTPETQIQRVMARNGWPREQVLAVLAQQASRAQRLAAADVVIDNDGIDLDTLRARVRAAWEWRGMPL